MGGFSKINAKTVASFRRRLRIPVSHARAGGEPEGGSIRRLRDAPLGIPTRGRIVLRVHSTTLR